MPIRMHTFALMATAVAVAVPFSPLDAAESVTRRTANGYVFRPRPNAVGPTAICTCGQCLRDFDCSPSQPQYEPSLAGERLWVLGYRAEQTGLHRVARQYYERAKRYEARRREAWEARQASRTDENE